MVFVCTAMGVLYVEHANVLELCYIELLSGDGSPYSILSGHIEHKAAVTLQTGPFFSQRNNSVIDAAVANLQCKSSQILTHIKKPNNLSIKSLCPPHSCLPMKQFS